MSPGWRLLALAAIALAATSAASAAAQSPPLPNFFWSYGTVQLDAANLDPPEQPVVALVGGAACGSSTTFIATASPDTPIEDLGRTVYSLNVRPDGTGAGQQSGCGREGESVLFWFPALSRFAFESPLFHQGEERVDLTLGPPLGVRLPLPFISDDGPLQ